MGKHCASGTVHRLTAVFSQASSPSFENSFVYITPSKFVITLKNVLANHVGCVLLCLCVCALQANALPFTNNILRCLQALCLHFAFFQALLFKNQSPANDRPQETVERITLPLYLLLYLLLYFFLSLSVFYPSLFLSARKVSLFTQASSPSTTTTTPPSLAGESGLRMPDVLQSEPRQCKHSALP